VSGAARHAGQYRARGRGLEICAELGDAVGLNTLRDAILTDLGEQDRSVFRVIRAAQVRPDLPRDYIEGIRDVDHHLIEEGHLHRVHLDHLVDFLGKLRLLPDGVLALRLLSFFLCSLTASTSLTTLRLAAMIGLICGTGDRR